jgi:hypothetical protein
MLFCWIKFKPGKTKLAWQRKIWCHPHQTIHREHTCEATALIHWTHEQAHMNIARIGQRSELLRRGCVNIAPVPDGSLILHEPKPGTSACCLVLEQLLAAHALLCVLPLPLYAHSHEWNRSVHVLVHIDDPSLSVALSNADTCRACHLWVLPHSRQHLAEVIQCRPGARRWLPLKKGLGGL